MIGTMSKSELWAAIKELKVNQGIASTTPYTSTNDKLRAELTRMRAVACPINDSDSRREDGGLGVSPSESERKDIEIIQKMITEKLALIARYRAITTADNATYKSESEAKAALRALSSEHQELCHRAIEDDEDEQKQEYEPEPIAPAESVVSPADLAIVVPQPIVASPVKPLMRYKRKEQIANDSFYVNLQAYFPGSLIIRHETQYPCFYLFKQADDFMQFALANDPSYRSFHECFIPPTPAMRSAIEQVMAGKSTDLERMQANLIKHRIATNDFYGLKNKFNGDIEDLDTADLPVELISADDNSPFVPPKELLARREILVEEHGKATLEAITDPDECWDQWDDADEEIEEYIEQVRRAHTALQSLIIDIDGEGIPQSDEQMLMELFEDTYRATWQSYFGFTAPPTRDTDYVVLSSCGVKHSSADKHYKFSMQIRSLGHCTTAYEAKCFAAAYRVELADEDMAKRVDMAVFTGVHDFRMPYQTKYEDNRFLRPVFANRPVPFREMLIYAKHDGRRPLPLMVKPEDMPVVPAQVTIGAARMEEARKIIDGWLVKNGLGEVFSYSAYKGAFLSYRRRRKATNLCAQCRREHTNDNSLFGRISNVGRVYVGCSIYNRERKEALSKGAHVELWGDRCVEVGAVQLTDAELASLKTKVPFAAMLAKIVDKTKPLAPVEPTPADTLDAYCELGMRDYPSVPTLLIQAPTGAGKTVALCRLIEQLPKDATIALLTMRITFSTKMTADLSRYGFVSYQKVTGPLDFSKHRRVVCQVESLHRIPLGGVDYLIIDESESVLMQLNSPYFKKGRDCRAVFRSLVHESDHVIAMDALASQLTVNMLRPRGQISIVRNSYVRNSFDWQISFDKLDWLEEVDRELAGGKHVCIPTNSKTAADGIAKLFRGRYPQKSVLNITGETAPEVKRELIDTIADSWKVDILIYTPTVSAGVSFTEEWFDLCCPYFTSFSCIAQDCIQMLARVRSFGEKRGLCYINPACGQLKLSREEIVRLIEYERADLMLPVMPDDNATRRGKYTPADQWYYELAIEMALLINHSRADFTREFVSRLYAMGHRASVLQSGGRTDAQVALGEALGTATAECKMDKAARVAKAVVSMDCAVIEEIQEKQEKTQEENDMLHKLYIGKVYGVEPNELTAQMVNDAQPDKLRRYQSLAVARLGLEKIKTGCADKLKFDLTDSSDLFNTYNYARHAKAAELLGKIGFAGIDDTTRVVKREALTAALTKEWAALREGHRDLCALFRIRSAPLTPAVSLAAGMELVNAVLRSMYGAKVITTKKTKTEKTDYRIVHEDHIAASLITKPNPITI